MDWSNFPSLNSLRAFAALAETGSYSRAASALNISHAAVSQQIKSLETRLGAKLVIREGRGVKLTDRGAALARELTAGFAAILQGLEELKGAEAVRPVQVTMPPAFAVRWLMPRLMEFQHHHPEVMLMLIPTAEVVELAPGGIDMAIRFGHGNWPGLQVAPLVSPDMVVVGARSLIGRRDIKNPATLIEMPWLQELGTNEVAEWMNRRGITPKRRLKITHMPGHLIMEAVLRGDGLTYTARSFVREGIQSGQLIEVSSETDSGHYYIITLPGPQRPPVRSFTKWLKRQAAMEISANL